MKNLRVRLISIILCFGMMAVVGTGSAAEPLIKERNRSHIELDPGNTGTYTGEAGKDNYIGNCSTCHGMTGDNDGPLSDSLGEGVVPRQLSDAKLLSSRSDDFLFKVIKFGGTSVGFSDAMPGWKDTFTDTEIKQIVQYVRLNVCRCKYDGKSK